MSKWYGSVENRLEENKMYCDKIKVGTLATVYFYSDRFPYEVLKVINDKHIFVRELSHKKKEGSPEMSNEWDLYSNPDNKLYELKFRYGKWKVVSQLKDGSIYYSDINISFGVAEYYFDYSF